MRTHQSESGNVDPVEDQKEPKDRSTPGGRQAWLLEWAQKNPLATVAVARAAVRSEFGTSMNNGRINQIMRQARQGLILNQNGNSNGGETNHQKHWAPDVPAIVEAMRQLRLRRVEIEENGKVLTEYQL